MPRKKLRYLCRATHHGRTIAGPHPDPNEVERQDDGQVLHMGGWGKERGSERGDQPIEGVAVSQPGEHGPLVDEVECAGR